jgi:hypothetical protein
MLYMRKRTRRKIYALVNPIDFAITGANVTDRASLDFLRERENKSYEAMCKGEATKQDWNNIAAVCNLAESMAANDIGPEVMVHKAIAEMHLKETRKRYLETGKMVSTGLALKAFKDILEWHDLQRMSVARSVYEAHIKKVTDMIRGGSPKITYL